MEREEELRTIRVLDGIEFLNDKFPDWLTKVGDLETLDVANTRDCLLCRVTGMRRFHHALTFAGIRPFENDSYDYGFSMGTNDRIDDNLTNTWKREIKKLM